MCIIPNVVNFIIRNKHKWVYFLVGIMFLISIYVLRYVNGVFYPGLLILIVSPMVVENLIVLYTNTIKYLNKD